MATKLLNIETRWLERAGVELTAVLSNGCRVRHPGCGFTDVIAICESVGIDTAPYREAQTRGYRRNNF